MAEIRQRRLPGAPADQQDGGADHTKPTLVRPHPALTQQHAAVPIWWSFVGLGSIVALTLLIIRLTHHETESHNPETLFSAQQLARYDGRASHRIYLAVMGQVFDVTPGRKHYEVAGGYGFFTAKDASRAYVTGKFKDDLHDDVSDFTPEQFGDLVHWRDFYLKHKDYRPVGRVAGRFYDSDGQPTPLLHTAEAQAAAAREAKARNKEAHAATAAANPPCNVRWSKKEGGWVYCREGEGGGPRYPRKIVAPDEGGALHERCACFEDQAHSRSRRLYDGCEPQASRCLTSAPQPDW